MHKFIHKFVYIVNAGVVLVHLKSMYIDTTYTPSTSSFQACGGVISEEWKEKRYGRYGEVKRWVVCKEPYIANNIMMPYNF